MKLCCLCVNVGNMLRWTELCELFDYSPRLCKIKTRKLTPHQAFELFKFHGEQRTSLCIKYGFEIVTQDPEELDVKTLKGEFNFEEQKQRNLRNKLHKLTKAVGKHHVFCRSYDEITDLQLLSFTQDLINILRKKLQVNEFELITEEEQAERYVDIINQYLIYCSNRI